MTFSKGLPSLFLRVFKGIAPAVVLIYSTPRKLDRWIRWNRCGKKLVGAEGDESFGLFSPIIAQNFFVRDQI
jgi:hypothetical protein